MCFIDNVNPNISSNLSACSSDVFVSCSEGDFDSNTRIEEASWNEQPVGRVLPAADNQWVKLEEWLFMKEQLKQIWNEWK